jgi:hypothetical protein
MSYKIFNESGDELDQNDLQYRPYWYKHGEELEKVFVSKFGKKLGIIINPQKTTDPTVPDFTHSNGLGDLKSQHTPLFTSKAQYGIPPTFAVTFNLKDVFGYGNNGANYKNFIIYFGVRWDAARIVYDHGLEQTVEPIDGIWRIQFDELDTLRHRAPLHYYRERPCVKTINSDFISTLKSFEPRLIQKNNDGTEYANGIRWREGDACVSYVFDIRKLERVDK